MNLPSIYNETWEQVIKHEISPEFEYLATKMLVGELISEYDQSSFPETLKTCVNSLYEYFDKNIENPKVQEDLKKIFERDDEELKTKLFSVEHVVTLIREGKRLIIAGDDDILNRLPRGNWIGGTIPYFMDADGGKFSDKRVYVTELPEYVFMSKTVVYNREDIYKVYTQSPKNGFSFIILPAFSEIHSDFALNCPKYDQFATKPLIGWVAGTKVDHVGAKHPKVYDGKTKTAYEQNAVVMHVVLPAYKRAEINILNIFSQGAGDTLKFLEDGFSAKYVEINGMRTKLKEYLTHEAVDLRLPLVADTFGAQINTSIQSIEKDTVSFYAPVFAGVEYRIAKPFKDYVSEFNRKIPKDINGSVLFSCNCILNYQYAELEGRKTRGFTGPITFGEVAYQLLNQTMVYLTIEDL